MLVDEHIVVRQRLSAVLEAYDEIELIGEAGSRVEGVDLATRLLPNSVSEQSRRLSATFYRSSISKLAFRPRSERCERGLSRRMRRTGRPTNAKISSYCQCGI